MAVERKANSVLAKLMGIERPSLAHKPQGRQRILSENYLQNIAFVTHRERSSSVFYEDEDEFTMAVDGNLESEDIVQLSGGTSVNVCQNLAGGSNNIGLSVYRGDSSAKTKLEEVSFLPQDQKSEHFKGYDLQGTASLCSEFGHLSNLSSSCTSAVKKQKLSKVGICQAKSQQNMQTGSFRCNISKDRLQEENGFYSPSKSIVELNTQNSNSCLLGRSSLSSSPSGASKENISSRVRNKGINFQRRKTKNLYDGIESPIHDRMSTHGIAKQVTSQVNDSVWHRFTDVSDSGSRSDKSSAVEQDETKSSSSRLSSLDYQQGTSSCIPIKKSASQDVCETKKELSEGWRTRKSDREVRTSCGNSNAFHCRIPFTAGDVKGWQVVAARYLSKPTLFPSVWVPRSKTRDLYLDTQWCLRIEKRDSLQCEDSMGNFGQEVLKSTSESSSPDLSSGEYNIKIEAQRIPNDSENLEESNMSEEISSVPKSSSERSPFRNVRNPIFYEALTTLSETDDKHLENHVSQKGSLGSALNCSVVSTRTDNGEIIDKGNQKIGACVNLQREQLSAEASTCVLLEEKGSSFPEFCSKHQVKENSSEPGSPVSSLEGPEACRCRPKTIVESKQISSVSEFLENNIHGFQTKLQSIDTISLESGSEGPEMAVSSDGDYEGGSVGCYREDSQIMELYGTSENRDFSYVVDVLSELGFPSLNLETEGEAWCSQGYVLNHVVFDALEKKYGKQTFWERSERKLLFDRMNLGLMDIARSLDPVITRRKPLAKRFSSMQTQKLIEEELWGLLVKQEEESKRASCNKVCGGEMEWLEIEKYTYLIVKEVESLLLDELVEDFVSMATFF